MGLAHDSWAMYYDFVYENTYENTYGQSYNEFTENTLNTIVDILPNGKIIDLGAGTGRITIPLAQMGYEVIAIEKSQPMASIIEQKKKSNMSLEIHINSIADCEDGDVDMVICLFKVLCYTITENELKNIIVSIRNTLKSNGYFFFDLPNKDFFCKPKFIHTEDFERTVTLSKQEHDDDVYLYHEVCKGYMNNVAFEYSDKFFIKYWDIEFFDKMLKEEGFIKIHKEFPQFSKTSSHYQLYKIIK